MVTVKFFALIRSNHRISEKSLHAKTLGELFEKLLKEIPTLTDDELNNAVIFINQKKVMHQKRHQEPLNDGDEIIFTNFVGGG